MRRRDVLAGLGSAGVLAGAGAVAVYGVPSPDEFSSGGGGGETDEADASDPPEPIEIETVDAPGSEAGTALVPSPSEPTFIDLFGTWCAPCIEQMPALAEAHAQVGDRVQFISATNEAVGEGRSITEDELVAWWDEHDGNWTLGLDRNAELTVRYGGNGYPTAAVVDASGRLQWSDNGIKSADELVSKIELVLEDDGEQ